MQFPCHYDIVIYILIKSNILGTDYFYEHVANIAKQDGHLKELCDFINRELTLAARGNRLVEVQSLYSYVYWLQQYVSQLHSESAQDAPELIDYIGQALLTALTYRSNQVIRYLVDRCVISTECQVKALEFVAENGLITEMNLILNKCDTEEKRSLAMGVALTSAAAAGRTDTINALLQMVNKGHAFLQQDIQLAIESSASYGFIQILNALLSTGIQADLTRATEFAAENGWADVVLALLEAAPKRDAQKHEWIAIDSAINNGRTNVLKVLQNKGVLISPEQMELAAWNAQML